MPVPPSMTSLPPLPLIVSLPANPLIFSLPEPPCRSSAALVPLMVIIPGSSSVIVTVAEPSVICAGTLSVVEAVSVNEKVSLLSTVVSSVVEMENVLDVSPFANEIVVLIVV